MKLYFNNKCILLCIKSIAAIYYKIFFCFGFKNSDEVCLLSASGTAALVKVYDGANSKQTDDTQKCMFNKNMDTEYEVLIHYYC